MLKFGSQTASPHCLAAQDVALSRPKHEFESRWGHFLFINWPSHTIEVLRLKHKFDLYPAGVISWGISYTHLSHLSWILDCFYPLLSRCMFPPTCYNSINEKQPTHKGAIWWRKRPGKEGDFTRHFLLPDLC